MTVADWTSERPAKSVRNAPGSTTVTEMPRGASSPRRAPLSALDRCLGGGVVARSHRGHLDADRGDVHDGAAASGPHAGQDGLDHRDGAEEVRLEQGADLGVVAFFDRGAITVAGVVDQDVDAAEPLLGLLHGGGDLVGMGDVKRDRSTRSGAASARSATLVTSRAVTTALWPAPMTASARARPSPVEQPVMSQVDMGHPTDESRESDRCPGPIR